MPSSASSTTLERTSSVPTLTDASPSPSSNSSRSSVLAELAIDADPHTHPDVITGPPSSIEEASQRATAQLNVARHLLSSARLYVNKADALRAVKSFGDILASLLGLRPSPHCDTSPYLHPSVVAHVSKLLSSDLYSWFMSSNDSIGAHPSLADPLIQTLEGLQGAVNEVTVKSLHIGPAVHEEKHSYSNLSRDDDTLTSSSHEDPHVVNLMTEAEKDSSNFQVAQEHSLIFAHAICSLLLSASSGLEASRFKRQVSSLANDVALKTPVIPSASLDAADRQFQLDQDDDETEGRIIITRPGQAPSPLAHISPRIEFPTAPALLPIASSSDPALLAEEPRDTDHVRRRYTTSTPDIGRQPLRPNFNSISSRVQRPYDHQRRLQSYAPAATQKPVRPRYQSLLSLSLAFTTPKVSDEPLSATTTTTTTTPNTSPRPVVTVHSTRSMFSKLPAQPHTLFPEPGFSSASNASTMVPRRSSIPTPPTLRHDMSRKSSLVAAQVIPASTNALASPVVEVDRDDEQAKWTPVRSRALSSPPMPNGASGSSGGSRGESRDNNITPVQQRQRDSVKSMSMMNYADRRPGASTSASTTSAKDLLFAVQSRVGGARRKSGTRAVPPALAASITLRADSLPELSGSANGRDPGGEGGDIGDSILSRIRTRALSLAPYYFFPSPSSPSTGSRSQNQTRASPPPTQAGMPTPTLMVTSPSLSPSSSTTRDISVSQILTRPSSAAAANKGRQTLPLAPRRRKSSSNNRPLPFRHHTLPIGAGFTATTPGSSSNNNNNHIGGGVGGIGGLANPNSTRRGPMPQLHPALAVVEQSSRLLKQSIRCAVCSDVGRDFPRCGKCGDAWCSRECRIKSLGEKKRHECTSNATAANTITPSAPAAAATTTTKMKMMPARHSGRHTPTPIPTPTTPTFAFPSTVIRNHLNPPANIPMAVPIARASTVPVPSSSSKVVLGPVDVSGGKHHPRRQNQNIQSAMPIHVM